MPEQLKLEKLKLYIRPTLKVYGDLRKITQAVGIPTKPDSTTARTAGTRAAT